MKTNLPISDREVPFPRGTYLVSKTDLKGVITHANDAFVKISGFARDELIGQSHNLVRHPDMPEDAFADLWRSVKRGLPWHGIVKNRAKNGDFYWVRATVVPVCKDGQTIGYMSVRMEPSRDEVRQADALYQSIRRKQAKLPEQDHGSGRLSGIYARLWLAMGGLAALMLGVAVAASTAAGGSFRGTVIAALAVVAAIAALAIGFDLSRRLRQPLQRVAALLQQIGEGNLSSAIDISGRDEAGLLLCQLDAMQVTLLAMIDDIRAASTTMDERCRGLESRLTTITEQSTRQHDSAKSIAAATQELSVSVREVAHGAGETSEASRRADAMVTAGNRQIGETLRVSTRVVEAVQRSGATIADLSTAIDKIGRITQVIKEIAGQTNLLALNAAIEAARAGEQGRGFAVVADEVRGLAERTSASTQEIAAMVAEIQSAATQAVAQMRLAGEEAETGIASMRQSASSLEGVTQASKDVTDMAHNISAATVQQTQASEEVANNMERISQLIEGNQEAAHDARQSATQLRLASDALKTLIGNFRLHAG